MSEIGGETFSEALARKLLAALPEPSARRAQPQPMVVRRGYALPNFRRDSLTAAIWRALYA